MKIVREEIDYKKLMKDNNWNMKKSEETDTVIAVDPTYADAMEQDKKAEEKVGEIMKKKKEEQKPIETPDPSTGKPLKKNMYTKQEELDESLFDDGDGEEVKEEKNSSKLPDDVFTMVYDFIFDGLHKTPASIKGLEDVEDVTVGAEKYFQDVQNFTNIGVQIKNDEKDIADYVKKIADALGFSTSEKRYERGVKNGDYVLFVEIPKDVAVMKASRFLGKNESLKEGKKLTETIKGEDILDDLVDRAIMNLKDGIDDDRTDVESAVEKAIDDGLIHNDDILSLGIHYDAIDTDDILDNIYSVLTNDLINKVTEKLGETYKSADESLKEEKKPVKESKKLTEDAKIYISLSDYRPWSGAVDTFDKIRKEDKMDELDAFIEETYPDGLTDTELNDLLWFEPEYVFDSLGIDYDEDEDEEDEDEDDEIELDFEEEDEEETDEE